MGTSNRTLVSSILFLDIVEYSKQSVTNQHALKQRFNTLLADALKHMAPSHRIVLDTGDGAAISFQVNPEDSMFVAMHLRDAIVATHAAELTPKLQLRFGINLGPVRLMNDLNGNVNIVGDGINVAQRVMSFAEPGSIFASRSYYEVVSHLTDDFAKLFSFVGMRTDKHVREYAIYEIGKTVNGLNDKLIAPAEDKARREDEEELGQREAEEQKRRMAELNTELAVFEQAQREEGETAKREAAEKARQEAEAEARRQEEERLKREAAEKARAEAEEKARIEEQARSEAEERSKREAEEQRRREAELKARLAAREQARHEEEEQARLAAVARPLHTTERGVEHVAKLRQVKWGKLTVLTLPLFVALLIGMLHLVPFSAKLADMETSASEQFGQPVKIESVHLSLFPPQWRLDGVTIGADAQIKAARVNAVVDIAGVFGAVKSYKLLDFESLVIKPEALGWVLFGTPNTKMMHIARLSALRVKLDSSAIDLPLFDAKADVNTNGMWQKLTLEYVDKTAFVELRPGNGRPQFEVNANNFTTPFSSEFTLNGFTAKGSIGSGDINMSEFEGGILGGTLNGNATLNWSGAWTLEGKVTAKGLNGGRMLPTLLQYGRVNGYANFAMLALDAKKLFDGARMGGTFSVSEGALGDVDLLSLLPNSSENGKINFLELMGGFNYDHGSTQLRQVRLSAGVLSASGSADVDAAGRLRGNFSASYTFDNKRSNTNISLSGSLNAPRFSH